MRFDPVLIINAGDMSQASITSAIIDLNQTECFAIQSVYSGSPVGSLTISGSCDIATSASGVSNWTALPNPVAISAAGSNLQSFSNVGFRWLKVVYLKTSGTGALSATFNGQGF